MQLHSDSVGDKDSSKPHQILFHFINYLVTEHLYTNKSQNNIFSAMSITPNHC